MIFRPESGLLYFNSAHVCDTVSERISDQSPPPRVVILDLSAAPYVDMHGAAALAGLAENITAAGIRFQAVEARSSVRDILRRWGVDQKLGGINRFNSVAEVVEQVSASEPSV